MSDTHAQEGTFDDTYKAIMDTAREQLEEMTKYVQDVFATQSTAICNDLLNGIKALRKYVSEEKSSTNWRVTAAAVCMSVEPDEAIDMKGHNFCRCSGTDCS